MWFHGKKDHNILFPLRLPVSSCSTHTALSRKLFIYFLKLRITLDLNGHKVLYSHKKYFRVRKMVKSGCWIWIVPLIHGLQVLLGASPSTHLNLNFSCAYTKNTLKPSWSELCTSSRLHQCLLTTSSWLMNLSEPWPCNPLWNTL